jgi:hypothetical protein
MIGLRRAPGQRSCQVNQVFLRGSAESTHLWGLLSNTVNETTVCKNEMSDNQTNVKVRRYIWLVTAQVKQPLVTEWPESRRRSSDRLSSSP